MMQEAVLVTLKAPLYDRSIMVIEVLIDRTRSRKQVFKELLKQLRPLLPAREIDPRLYKAVRAYRDEGLSYAAASMRAFGTAEYAERVRYWNNRVEI